MLDTISKIAAATQAFAKKHRISVEEIEGKWIQIPTGVPFLDGILGGGIPRGAIIEIYGEPGAGKSTLSYFLASKIAKNGGVVLYIDVEGEVNAEWAAKNGLDFSQDNVKLLRFDYAEHALSYIETIAGSVSPEDNVLIVLDSIAALVPAEEAEQEIDKANIAIMARLASKFMRRAKNKLRASGTTLLAINQVRANPSPFAAPETTPGGYAWKFGATARFKISYGSRYKTGDMIEGHEIKITPKKNKLSFLNFAVRLPLYTATGINEQQAIVEQALEAGVLQRNGSFYRIGDQTFHGMSKLVEYLKEQPEALQSLAQRTYEAITNPNAGSDNNEKR
ncbi:MAG: AAA family ATPase [Armatimonadetes bacterium]|nr:AAA family ATPase [Armatimonadota bacterium]